MVGLFWAHAQYNGPGHTLMKQARPAGQEEAGSNRLQGGCPPWGLGAGKEEVKVQETSHSTGLYQGEVALKSFQTQRVSPEEPACDTQPPRGLRAGQGAEIGPPNG